MITALYLYHSTPAGQKLSESDKRDGQRVGAYLAAQHARIATVCCTNSPLYLELAQKLVKAMGQTTNLIIPYQPSATTIRLEELLSQGEETEASGLLYLGSRQDGLQLHRQMLLPEAALPPADRDSLQQVCWADTPCRAPIWSPGFLLPREQLPKKFPFPAPNGPERRDRPAYYYRQSSVIPYQKQKKGLNVLIIGSSKRKHLVVPKGIQEPGLSARESAAKESFEEAGVLGPVLSPPLGSYTYSKWGADCTVTVYAQKVEALLPEAEWEESHRGRQWMSPERAASRVKEPQLGRLIHTLEHFLQKELA